MFRFCKNISIGILTLTLVFGPFATTPTYAQFGGDQDDASASTQENFEDGVVMCAATAVALYLVGLIPGISVPTVDTPALLKEAIFDCVFWAFKNAIIQEVTGSTVQWVQTGLNGNPAFVQNVNGYLRSLADQVAGTYIEDVAPFLCSPFRAEIQLQLTLLYQQSSGRGAFPVSCTLTDVVGNVDAFLDGNFAAGGWSGWFELVTNPSNNRYGAFLEASDELASRIRSSTGEAEKKLELGNGFFSKEIQQCYTVGADGTRTEIDPNFEGPHQGTIECDEPKIVTPGSQIKTSLEQAFNLNLDNIASADEFDEIFSLVAAYLISDILTQEKGLAGYDPAQSDAKLPDVTIPNTDTGGGATPVDSQPPGPPGPSMCFTNSSTFIPQRGGTVFAQAEFPVPQNVSYDALLFEIDVKNTGWRPLDEQPPAPKGTRPWVYNIFYLPRIPGALDVFGYINVRGPEGPSNYTNKVISQHGVGQGWLYKPTAVSNLSFPVGATYRFSYVYDAANDVIGLIVTDTATGSRVGGIQTVPDAEINVGSKRFAVDLGFPLHSGNVYDTPSYGWEYSNLKVQFLSTGDAPGACESIGVSGSTGGSSGASGGSTAGGGSGGTTGPFIQDWDPIDTPISGGGGGSGGSGGGGDIGTGVVGALCTRFPSLCGGGEGEGTGGGSGDGGTGPGGTPGEGEGECTDLNCSPPQI